MEGIIDTSTDPAFDIADICNEDENSPEQDETLTSMSSRGCLDNIPVYRDLSAWRIQIPNVVAQTDQNNKKIFVFLIEVHRIDIDSTKENAEDLQWKVYRR